MGKTDDIEDVSKIAANPEELRRATEEIVDFGSGNVGGYVQVETNFDLNKLAIGLGLENIEYEPDRFPGLVYRHARPDGTTLIFEDGQLTVVDAQSEEAVREIIVETIVRLSELGLCEAEVPNEEKVTVSTTQ